MAKIAKAIGVKKKKEQGIQKTERVSIPHGKNLNLYLNNLAVLPFNNLTI